MARFATIFCIASLVGVASAREAPKLTNRFHEPDVLAGEQTRRDRDGKLFNDAEGLGPASDFVSYLPGYGEPPTATYSGFLDAGAAEPGTKLHYWFAACDSKDDPATKPTVLWLNGGPGSSSILGWLQEVGPLLTNSSGGLMRNPWAWTRLANVFALEAPAGVGYSYCDANLRGGNCENTDGSTAKASLAALIDFFGNKFPKLQNTQFFIAGESYAGVYVPTLAREILWHNERTTLATLEASVRSDDADFKGRRNSGAAISIPLAGVAVGDPCTDNEFQRDSMDMLWYANKHGLVDQTDFELLWNECGHRAPRGERRGRWEKDANGAGGWKDWVVGSDEKYEEEETEEDKTDWIKDEYDDAEENEENSTDELTKHKETQTRKKTQTQKESAKCVAARRRFRLSTSDGFSQTWEHAWLNDLTLYGPSAAVRDDIPGTLDYDMSRWMMRADVREALHVENSPAISWPGPSDGWRYESQYAACNDLSKPGAESMIDMYRYLAPKLKNTIVFNGDTDPCVSWEGTRGAIEAVGFALIDGGDQRPYFVKLESTSDAVLKEKPLLFGPDLSLQKPGVQFAGHVTSYAHNLSFVTVHGSGHMVPQFRPQAGFHLLKKLLSGSPFSPALPNKHTLMHESESEFAKTMDRWTVLARSGAYVDGEDGAMEATF